MEVGLAQKMGALAWPAQTDERAFALAVVECVEQELYIYPAPKDGKLRASGYRFFCVLPCAEQERVRTKERLLRVLEHIAREEECIADTSTGDDGDLKVCIVYFRFRK